MLPGLGSRLHITLRRPMDRRRRGRAQRQERQCPRHLRRITNGWDSSAADAFGALRTLSVVAIVYGSQATMPFGDLGARLAEGHFQRGKPSLREQDWSFLAALVQGQPRLGAGYEPDEFPTSKLTEFFESHSPTGPRFAHQKLLAFVHCIGWYRLDPSCDSPAPKNSASAKGLPTDIFVE
jgi:hypothetical protein